MEVLAEKEELVCRALAELVLRFLSPEEAEDSLA